MRSEVSNSANDTGFKGDMGINKGLILKCLISKKIQKYDIKCDSHIEKKTIITYLYQKINVFTPAKTVLRSTFFRRLRGTTAALTTTWRSEMAPWRQAL